MYPHYHNIILDYCHIITLPCSCKTILSYDRVLTLPYHHIVIAISSYCNIIIASCHNKMISYCRIIMSSYYHSKGIISYSQLKYQMHEIKISIRVVQDQDQVQTDPNTVLDRTSFEP